MNSFGKFIFFRNSKTVTWLNTEQIILVRPAEKQVANPENQEVENVPDGLFVYMANGESCHVAEELKDDFNETMKCIASQKNHVEIDGTVSVCTQMYNGEPTPLDICLLKWCGDHYETK